jgi:hypothetical protein
MKWSAIVCQVWYSLTTEKSIMAIKSFIHIMTKLAHCAQFISFILNILSGKFLYKN